MEIVALVAFLTASGLLAYAYVGYPLLLRVGAWMRGGAPRREGTVSRWPKVTVVLSAYNEEAVIADRIENLLDVEYPADCVQVIIGSDGSSDRTCEVIRQYRTRRIKLYDFPARRGKATVLNDVVGAAEGDIVIFTDANTWFHPQAIRELVRGFQEHPSACAVVGQLQFRTVFGSVNPDGLYWRYECMLKRLESEFGTLLGANGAIYAIKRARYRPLPPGTIVDDFLLPMLIRLHGGGSVVFRPSAIASEFSPETVRDEFRRRMRIGAGDAHALLHTWRLLLPSRGMLALSYWSHKVLRWCGPVLLLVLLVSNIALLAHPWARWLLGIQSTCYALALAAPLLRPVPGLGRAATALSYFLLLNAALLVGFTKFVVGRTGETWQTTSRTADMTFSTARRVHDGAERRHVDRTAA